MLQLGVESTFSATDVGQQTLVRAPDALREKAMSGLLFILHGVKRGPSGGGSPHGVRAWVGSRGWVLCPHAHPWNTWHGATARGHHGQYRV